MFLTAGVRERGICGQDCLCSRTFVFCLQLQKAEEIVSRSSLSPGEEREITFLLQKINSANYLLQQRLKCYVQYFVNECNLSQ